MVVVMIMVVVVIIVVLMINDHGGGDGYESCGDLLRGEDGDQSGGDGGDNPYNNAGDHRHKGNRGKRKQWIGKQKKLNSTGCPHNFV